MVEYTVQQFEHGMIYTEQYKHGGSMEDRENSFNHQYKYSSKIELTQEVGRRYVQA